MKRFEVVHEDGLWSNPSVKILVDRETGVNYLYVSSAASGCSITPLLDAEGKPIVTK